MKEIINLGDKRIERSYEAEPEEFEIGGGWCTSFAITNKENELIALIEKDQIIIKNGYNYAIDEEINVKIN